MNCHKAQALLVSFLAGDLAGGERDKVEAHLKVCPKCREEAELLSKSWQMLDDYAAPKLKDDFTSSLMERIRSEEEKPVRAKFRLPQFDFQLSFPRLVPVVATLLVAVLTFSLVWKRQIGLEREKETVPTPSREVAVSITDEEIIQDLDLYADIELLENLDLLNELDVVEGSEELTQG